MSSRPPPKGPYRDPAAAERLPPSPDIDPSIVASSPTTPLLVMSGLFFPVWLLLTWLTDMTVHGCGPTHVETTAEKMGTTIVLTLVFAVLLALRVRHSRRQSAALRMLRVGLEEPNVELGGEREDARVRVDSSTIASDSAEAAEEAVASDSAIELEVGGLDAATTGTDRSVRGRDRRR